MNMISVPFSPFNSLNESCFPETVSGKLKTGARVPGGLIIERVRAKVLNQWTFKIKYFQTTWHSPPAQAASAL